MKTASSFDHVLTLLGGAKGIGRITGAQASAICNWRARGEKFPARHFHVLASALARRQVKCPRSLFTFEKPKKQANGKKRAA